MSKLSNQVPATYLFAYTIQICEYEHISPTSSCRTDGRNLGYKTNIVRYNT